jgi:D-glycero-D-manno-heptose 1,7-bisphosphate phosphatase
VSARAVFLDRDGTINKEVSFLSDANDVELERGAVEGLKALQCAGFQLVVVSNQSGVARGYFDEKAVKRANGALSRMLAARGVTILRFYYCPHHPEGSVAQYSRVCDCRKPEPGLLLRAAQDADIDLGASYSVGDSARDLSAGRRAGTRTVLVLTGYGRGALEEVEAGGLADFVAPDLEVAAKWIVRDSRLSGGRSVED